MAMARALVKLVHNCVLRLEGDIFEYEGKLKGLAEEGMEWVTPKSDKAYAKAQAEAWAALRANVDAAEGRYHDIQSQLTADPSRGDLVAQVLDAETKLQEAQAALAAADVPAPAPETPDVSTDLV